MRNRNVFIKKISTLLFVFISIISTLFCVSINVHAAINEPDSNKTLYYFTDNPNYEYYLDGVITSNGFSGNNVENYYYSTHGFENAGELEYEIINLYDSGFFSFDNSIVIFEMRDGFIDECYEKKTVFAQYLEYIFRNLKEECTNNSIMFICGTDEALFSNYSNFLNYVDIHINTDIATIFMYNAMERIEQNTENSPYTLVLDGLCKPVNDFLITKYLVPRYRYLYQMYAYDLNYKNEDLVLSSVYSQANIQVIGIYQNSQNEYYDYATNSYYNIFDLKDKILGDYVYGVGTTFNYANFMN